MWRLSPDPICSNCLDPQQLNRYSYVRNNPVNAVDPDGLDPIPYDQFWGDYMWAGPHSGASQALEFYNMYLQDSEVYGFYFGQYRPWEYWQNNSSGSPGGTQTGGPGGRGNPANQPAAANPINNGKAPCNEPVTPYTVNATTGLGTLGAAIGGGLGGPAGGFIGFAIGSMFGVGVNASWVPQTNQWYVGPTANFSPGFWGGTGMSAALYNFPNAQRAGNVLSSWSGSMNIQPTPVTGATIIKSPGNSPAVGYTVGSRLPVAFGGGYNWLIWSGKCQ